MQYFDWDEEKNSELKHTRGVSFEEVVFHLARGDILDILEHPNPKEYPGQRIFILAIDGYAHIVPFVEEEERVFLKTIIPSRKMTKKYLKEGAQ